MSMYLPAIVLVVVSALMYVLGYPFVAGFFLGYAICFLVITRTYRTAATRYERNPS